MDVLLLVYITKLWNQYFAFSLSTRAATYMILLDQKSPTMGLSNGKLFSKNFLF